MKKLFHLLILSPFLLLAAPVAQAQSQPEYIPEQLTRDAHHIIQSLGAFVGNERAESQSFDITYMPAGNGVEGNMIINTADYRCTFKLDANEEICYEVTLDVRSQDFLNDFYKLFSVYPTEPLDGFRLMHFGNERILVEETPSRSTRYRSFKMTIAP